MPKIIKKKTLSKYPITLYKYPPRNSKFWYYRFWVGVGYKSKGMEDKSTYETDERTAEKIAVQKFKKFDFTNYSKTKSKKEVDIDKDIFQVEFKYRKLDNPERVNKEIGMYKKYIQPVLKDIDYRNIVDLELAVQQIFYNMKLENLAVATCRNYKIIMTNAFARALKNNNVPLNQIPHFPKLKGDSIRRLSYSPKEQKMIIDTFRKSERYFDQELGDYLAMTKSSGFRPGMELLRIRRNHIGWINDPNQPEKPVMKVLLTQTKVGKEHRQTLADWFRDDVYPRMMNRYPDAKPLDYLFYPNEENRTKLFERVRSNFERISNNLGLYDVDGNKRPLYTFRHSFISQRRSKGVDSNVVSLNSNTGVNMINKHYQTLDDSNLLDIHNQLFPERTTNTNHKNIKKK